MDDAEDIDLLAENCSVEWIITRAALRQGSDCSFAYILVHSFLQRAPPLVCERSYRMGWAAVRAIKRHETRRTGLSAIYAEEDETTDGNSHNRFADGGTAFRCQE